jgi:cytochrome c6
MKNHALIAAMLLLASAVTVSAAGASTNWEELCAKCHGADGKGQTKMGKKLKIRDYTDAAVQGKFTDEDALKALKEGLKDGSGKQLMKPVEGLSDDDLKALVQHVRSLKA